MWEAIFKGKLNIQRLKLVQNIIGKMKYRKLYEKREVDTLSLRAKNQRFRKSRKIIFYTRTSNCGIKNYTEISAIQTYFLLLKNALRRKMVREIFLPEKP